MHHGNDSNASYLEKSYFIRHETFFHMSAAFIIKPEAQQWFLQYHRRM